MAPDTSIQPSVCHRHPADRWPSAADYDEAIEALQLAKSQLAPDGDNCAVCGDSGHQAFECGHNPLLLARRWTAASSVWRCWHCGLVATTQQEAEGHFGLNDEEPVACLRAESANQEDLVMLVSRLAHRIRRTAPGDPLADRAIAYLQRHSLANVSVR